MQASQNWIRSTLQILESMRVYYKKESSPLEYFENKEKNLFEQDLELKIDPKLPDCSPKTDKFSCYLGKEYFQKKSENIKIFDFTTKGNLPYVTAKKRSNIANEENEKCCAMCFNSCRILLFARDLCGCAEIKIKYQLNQKDLDMTLFGLKTCDYDGQSYYLNLLCVRFNGKAHVVAIIDNEVRL